MGVECKNAGSWRSAWADALAQCLGGPATAHAIAEVFDKMVAELTKQPSPRRAAVSTMPAADPSNEMDPATA
eukprot:4741380-Alexandrium_andersonii.AAC.1